MSVLESNEEQSITEYDFQQSVKDEKDLQYESQNLQQTLDTLKSMLIVNENTEQMITLKDLQNIVLEQTTLDLLMYILQLINQFMARPIFLNAQQNFKGREKDSDSSMRQRKLWTKISSKLQTV